MKKFFTILLLVLVPSFAHAGIVITEIMYDLSGSDESREWVEIYNDGPVYNLSNWKFFENNTNHSLTYIQGGSQGGGQIYTDEYAVIADNSGQFLVDHPDFQGLLFDSSFSLNNTGEIISIRYPNGDVANEVTYLSSWGASGDGNSLQLSGSEWVVSSSTPGSTLSNSSGGDEPLAETITISGVIASDTTWSPSDGIYVLDGEVTVTASTTLTIEPGTVVKAKNGGSSVLKLFGMLNAVGTSTEKIIFTSILDDSVGGHTNETDVSAMVKDWQGIVFESGSRGSLEYLELRYGGYQGFGIKINGGVADIVGSVLEGNYASGVLVNSGKLTIHNSVLSNNARGLEIWGGTVLASSNNFTNNSAYGVYARGEETHVNLQNNNFSSNAKTAYIEASVDFTHSGNTSSDIANRGFETSGYVRDGAVWHSDDLPTVNIGGIKIPTGNSLTLSPGMILKMTTDAYLQVDGNFIAKGTETDLIYITSLKDDLVLGDTNSDGSLSTPSMGSWSFVLFSEGSMGDISQSIIRYAGGYIYPYIRSAVVNLGGDLKLNSVSFSDNYESDIYQSAGSLDANNSNFASQYSGLIFEGDTATISRSNFYYNSVAIDNRSASSTVVALNNWWGTGSGPRLETDPAGTGGYIYGDVNFDPWIKRDPALPNPVIIVPGMMGSVLVNPDLVVNSEKWPNIIMMLLPGDDNFLDELSLFKEGDTTINIFPSEIMKEIQNEDFLKGLIDLLISVPTEYYEYPYDWRLDILKTASDLENNSILSLQEKIEEVKTQTGAEKIDIVAHSMGGLLVKKYLKDFGGNAVNKFIDIATPHEGSPKAFKILSFGDNFGFEKSGLSILNPQRIKIIGHNMPAAYQLLPSRNYFDDSDNDYKYYVFDAVNGNDRLSFDQTKDYLKSEGRNSALVDRADKFHQEIDGLNPADYDVEAYNIVGCGTPTIGQFYILEKNGDHYNYNIRMVNGDGTVPLKSAQALPAMETYYVKNAKHAVMPSTSGVKELIASILTGMTYDISDYQNIVESENECPIPNGKIVSFHSPINLHVYDSDGNHVGPNENGDIENNILGVVYEEIENNKFAFLPDGQEYQITGKSTGSGAFDVRIETMVDGEVAQTTIFSDIPLANTTQTNFDVGMNIPSQIYLDHDGDNNFESTVPVSTTTTGFLESTGSIKSEVIESNPEPEKVIAIISQSSSRPGTQSVINGTPDLESLSESQLAYRINPNLYIGLSQPETNVVVTTTVEKIATTSERDSYQNTAIVYKSFTQKAKELFKSLWFWFKSRL